MAGVNEHIPFTDRGLEISHGRVVAQIDPQGAYIDRLYLDEARTLGLTNLLLPRQLLGTANGVKARGTHPCVPVFGYHLQQEKHGFGRQLPWNVVEHNGNQAVMNLTITGEELVKGAKFWEGLSTTLRYQVEDVEDLEKPLPPQPRFMMDMVITNNGKQSRPVAPGFHPYFLVPRNASAASDHPRAEVYIRAANESGFSSFSFTREELANARFQNLQDRSLHLAMKGGGVQVRITHENLPQFAFWSDMPETYICAEPTALGELKTESKDSKEEEAQLEPGETRTYSTKIAWGL